MVHLREDSTDFLRPAFQLVLLLERFAQFQKSVTVVGLRRVVWALHNISNLGKLRSS